jgi:hypothetical protein
VSRRINFFAIWQLFGETSICGTLADQAEPEIQSTFCMHIRTRVAFAASIMTAPRLLHSWFYQVTRVGEGRQRGWDGTELYSSRASEQP